MWKYNQVFGDRPFVLVPSGAVAETSAGTNAGGKVASTQQSRTTITTVGGHLEAECKV